MNNKTLILILLVSIGIALSSCSRKHSAVHYTIHAKDKKALSFEGSRLVQHDDSLSIIDAHTTIKLPPGTYEVLDNRQGVIIFNSEQITGWFTEDDSNIQLIQSDRLDYRYEAAIKPGYFIVKSLASDKYSYIKESHDGVVTTHNHITPHFYSDYTIDTYTITFTEGYITQIFDKKTDIQLIH